MSSDADESVLKVERLRVEEINGHDIIDDVSFELRPSEVFALVGESGCGKTTTALALLGHSRAGARIASGAVRLAGVDLLQLSPAALRRVRGSQISYVPQDPTLGLNPRHRIGRQIAEILKVHGVDRAATDATVCDLLDKVGLPSSGEMLRRYPHQLSGGQQQRVAIAMALACKPLVVVLDEPTTGLDVTTQARVLELLRALSLEYRAAFLYVSHDLAVVDNLADSVAVMYSGRIVEVGRLDSVFRHPSHPYTSLLMKSVPRLAVRQTLSGIPGTALSPGARPTGCFFAPRCPLAVERCESEFPPESAVEAEFHFVRCWRRSDTWQLATQSVRTNATEVPSLAEHLHVHDLAASYGRKEHNRTIIHGLSLSIAAGECLALVGESGSGKTTLGRCIAGLHRPDRGVIMVSGSVVAPYIGDRSRAHRRAIQMIYQNPHRSLNPAQSIRDAIASPLRLLDEDLTWSAARTEVQGLLDRVRLPQRVLDRYPRELSGGEKQRVAIARALAVRPSVLICDEITSSLDVSIQAAIVSLLGDLLADGLAVLFITHNVALVHAIADCVYVLEHGELRDYGPTAEVLRRPSHLYTKELLAAVPDLRHAAEVPEPSETL
jgi:peptide/nickel transport system ATP-binding protein